MTTPVRLGRVCVLGLGVAGEATASFLLDALERKSPMLDSMVIYAGRANDKTIANAQRYIDEGIEVVVGERAVEGRFDTCIVSPGISNLSDFYQSGKKAAEQIMSEPELAYLFSPRNWIGITGTNGKTTTTALCAHLLRTAGFSARAVGNIGDPCITAVRDRGEGEYLVAELSSFQLASMNLFSPRVAVLLNITPDHVTWHGSHQAYIDAKKRIFGNLQFDSLAIVDVSNPDASVVARELIGRGVHLLPINSDPSAMATDAAFEVDGELQVDIQGLGRFDLGDAEALPIKGSHNITDALAASAAALFCGADEGSVRRGLLSFEPLEHRIEYCGDVDGVSYYNDSKATNVDAVLKALTAFGDRPLILLLGGKDKMTDLSELASACDRRCRAVVCFGEASERFCDAFEGAQIEVLSAQHLRDAVDTARSLAVAGDVIALSPACSSFDEFSCFEQRGRVFKDYVSGLPGEHT